MPEFWKPFKHRDAQHFACQKAKGVWRGPTRRATEALAKFNAARVATEEEYLDYLQEHYPSVYQNLEWVTFYDFVPRKPADVSALRLAVTNLKPEPLVRDFLFSVRVAVTVDTGWYPLVMGSKVSSANLPYHERVRREVITRRVTRDVQVDIGKLLTIEDVADQTGGTSFLLRGETGSLLMDAGYGVRNDALHDVRAVFLSHSHKDHSGGLWQVTRDTRAPVIMGETSLAAMWMSGRAHRQERDWLMSKVCVIESPAIHLRTDGELEVFPVFHAPGAHGMRYHDRHGTAVYYLGDVCLRNGFLDRTNELLSRLQADHTANRWVMVDAAMINRDDASVTEDQSPRAILQAYANNGRSGTAFFVSSNTEALIYAFVLAFYLTRGSADELIKIFLSEDLYALTRELIRPVLLHNTEQIDPFVESLLGRSVINFIESQRVYPLRSIRQIGTEQPAIVFASQYDLFAESALHPRLPNSDIIVTGRPLEDEELWRKIRAAQARLVYHVNSPDWYFHTGESDLSQFVNTLATMGVHTVLFHQQPRALRQFITRQKLDPALVHVGTGNTVELVHLGHY